MEYGFAETSQKLFVIVHLPSVQASKYVFPSWRWTYIMT